MKKFDRIIKLLVDEKYRIIGKTAVKLTIEKQNTEIALNKGWTKTLNDAIEILENYKPTIGRPIKSDSILTLDDKYIRCNKCDLLVKKINK